jgi:hypothetical protein
VAFDTPQALGGNRPDGQRHAVRAPGTHSAAAFAHRQGYRPEMVSVNEAARMALALPEVTAGERHGNRTWSVSGKAFAWERPFSKADIRRFGDSMPPPAPILAVRVEDLAEKEAVLAANTKAFFTIPHFDGYAAVLIQLKTVTKRALRQAIVDGWLACAPRNLADEYVRQEATR